jgi:hypothetical protein
MSDAPWGSFDTISTPGGGGGYVDSGIWDTGSGSAGFDWGKAAQTFGQNSGGANQPAPGTVPSLQAPNTQTPAAPVGRPGQPISLQDLLTLLMQRQQMYQQAAIGPAGAGGPPQMPAQASARGLLGI